MGKKDERKFENLHRLIELLLDHPEGLIKSEIGRRLNVDRSTAADYLDSLEAMNAPVYEVSPDRFTIDRDRFQVEISVDMHESMALHLATRLLTTRTDKHNPHAASALRKLGRALEKLAPLISEHMRLSAEILDADDRRRDPIFMQALETLTRAWSRRRKVRLTHELEDSSIHEYTFSPYFIEPYAVGRTMHVIGLREPINKIRTFKIERIRTITLLENASYEIPATFDPRAQLRDAWGIWFTENEPVTVKLKFTRKVAPRIRETVWHYNQKPLVELENGDVIWEADVADWHEMVPWIRGWGADLEVLEPEKLRKVLKREVQELATLYKIVEAEAKQVLHYAHSRKGEDKSEWQLLIDHLKNTADLAEKFGADAGVSELARIAALLHDIGKYSKEFQARLDGSGSKVDHATAGAKEVRALFNKDQNQKFLADMLAYCIAGHHTGLPDYGDPTDLENGGTLLARVEKKLLKDYSAYQSEINPTELMLPARLKIKFDKKRPGFSCAFLTRMIFSALVDADFQETETYMNRGEKPRGGYDSIEELCKTFNDAMQKFDNPQGSINIKRTETLKACKEKANSEQGFFTLTIPTGGGKTLASMAFALNHAVKHGLKRVIYVIPFTSIIEQNAAVFKEHLGEKNVLEHHSNFDWKKGSADTESADDETKDALDKLKLASENWDIPIVVTTNVQFFESLFANNSSRCRKLHNLAKSVIIFDEAQMLPREYLDPCMLAVKELVTNYGTSAVFCTATQPALEKRLQNVKFTELAPDPQALFDFYKRVQIIHLGSTPDADLIEKLQAHPQAVCIVNTRKHAKGLFDQLGSEGSFHLSTLMCPTHRKEVLSEVRARLKSGLPCRVISTQVMEAGIDVDFPVGFRALAGLDSILQAAGRVNREMKREVSDVFVFDPETPFIRKTPEFIRQGATVAEIVLREFSGHPDSKMAIEHYFNFLYNIQGKNAFDPKNILGHFDKGSDIFDFDFKTAAEHFKMIDNNTVAVVIPYNEEASQLLTQARYHPFPYTFARQLQMYTVNIYENEFKKLQSKGVIETINDTYEALTESSKKVFYNENTGLVLPADAGGDAIFIDV